MPKSTSVSHGHGQEALFLRPDKSHVAMAVALGTCLTTLILLSGRHGAGTGSESLCASLDEPANAAVVRLVHDNGDVGHAQLNEAVALLRRARNHCRHGYVALARNDYNALMRGSFNRAP
jgi:hypothetical protein